MSHGYPSLRQVALEDTLDTGASVVLSVLSGSPSPTTRAKKRRSSSHGKRGAMLNPRKTLGKPMENGESLRKT